MRKTVPLILILSFVFSASADTIPGVKFVEQEKYEWCWAACSQCLLKYHIPGFNRTQTEIAGLFTTKDTAPAPEYITEIIEHFGDSSGLITEWIERPLSWEEVKAETEQKHPFIIIINWNHGGGYHAMVYAGYHGSDSMNVRCMDPIMGWNYMSYDEILQVDKGDGYWGSTIKVSSGSQKVMYSTDMVITRKQSIMVAKSAENPYIVFNRQVCGNVYLYSVNGALIHSTYLSGNVLNLDKKIASGTYLVGVESYFDNGQKQLNVMRITARP